MFFATIINSVISFVGHLLVFTTFLVFPVVDNQMVKGGGEIKSGNSRSACTYGFMKYYFIEVIKGCITCVVPSFQVPNNF